MESLGVPAERILIAKDMAEFLAKFEPEVALRIFDLRLPAYEGAVQDNNGLGILQAMDRAGAAHVKLLAISAFPEEFADVRPQFESWGCMLVDFNEKNVWRNVLKQMVLQLKSIETLDFLIFCALRAEGAPYTGMEELAGAPKFKDNLSRLGDRQCRLVLQACRRVEYLSQMCQTVSVVCIGLVCSHIESGLGMARVNADRRQTLRSERMVKPN